MPRQSGNKPIILVIEDYGDSREMLKLILETLEYHVMTAANGHEALALAASNDLDLILTDLGLPDMDGLLLVRRLRKLNARLRYVPIIMLTALDRNEYYDPALRAGCTDFLTKPTDFETLQAMIEKLLQESRHDREEAPNGVQFRELENGK